MKGIVVTTDLESRIDKRILPLLKEITQEAPTDGK